MAFAQAPDGAVLYTDFCAECHDQQAGEQIPGRTRLESLTANAILRTMTDGAMRLQAEPLTADQQVVLAEYLSGEVVKPLPLEFDTGMCPSLSALEPAVAGKTWFGWSNNVRNTRYQTDTGGLQATDVPNLKLTWAFGIPDIVQSRSQPAIYGGRLFMGSLSGMVYALDARSGCTYWTFQAGAGVRTAISVARLETAGGQRTVIFFTDQQTNAYAVDAENGEMIWSQKVEEHPAGLGTGAPTLHGGYLYVPVSGLTEEGAGGREQYECCTFRGSVTALAADTGEVAWKTYLIPAPKKQHVTRMGTQLWGPAGVGVWSAPTIDVKRGLLYIGTGNAYAGPAVETSNAIVALELESGEINWVNQVLEGDIWIYGCDALTSPDVDPRTKPNCPDEMGPDHDIAASPMLVRTKDGRDIIVATQKSGMAYGLDPDQSGMTLWRYQWGQGSAGGGVYGAASDGELAYFPVADLQTDAPGGLHAVNVVTGQKVWFTPPQPLMCDETIPGCSPAQLAAATAIPGVVFSGSSDGGIRAYSTASGRIIWYYNSNREFDTVNGITARGASIDGPGVVIADGMVYVTSGNGGFWGMPGNVLLAFSPENE
jgi:polyvinyl alcohol dehydrogenase (cytochrome)